MRQEVSEEDAEDWLGEAADDEDEQREDRGRQQQRRQQQQKAQRKRSRGADDEDEDGDMDMDGADEGGAGAAAAGAASRAARAARRGGGGLSQGDWQTVGHAMLAGQAARQRAGVPTGELALGELQEQLVAAGLAVEEAALVALLQAASDAFGDMDSPDAAKYASSLPNFMWLPDEKLISFMS